MKRKLAAALLVVLVMASMATAYARVEWGYWVDGPDGFYLEDPANYANNGWGDGEPWLTDTRRQAAPPPQ